ncbi:c-type cytochrome [Hydrogenimonas sp.]
MKKIVGAVACLTVLSVGAMAAEMSNAQIYEKYCKKCHGVNGEGNPAKKGPALNDKDVNELFDALMNLEEKGFETSEHEAMTHNMKVLERKKGIKVNPQSMAKYLYYSFNPYAKNK